MSSRNRRIGAGLAVALLAGAGGIAVGQTGPESLLPPGFGAPPPAAPAPVAPVPGGPTPPTITPTAPPPTAAGEVPLLDLPPPSEEEIEKASELELPAAARRPIETVGFLAAEQGGFGPRAFGGANGAYLSALLHRLNAPFPSRWASINLRRALTSRVAAPRGVRPADWVAERAWTLLRMGEADAARMLVQSVDGDRFSPWLLAVSKQASLATGDPAGLCPIAQAGLAASKDPTWPLAQGICAALSGEGGTATAIFDRSRQRGVRGIDLLLAEKAAGAGIGGRRAVNIDWAGTTELTAWRFGLASAVAVPIPLDLYAGAGPQVRAWAARAPMLTLRERLPFARLAAAMGVFSSRALVDLYAANLAETDAAEIEGTTGQQLRDAYVAASPDDRIAAMKAIWERAGGPMDRYAALILTARAAARIAPSDDHEDDAKTLIAAMLSAGLDTQAARWSAVVEAAGEDGEAWALLAVGSPRPAVAISADRAESFMDDAGGAKGRLLVAALAGLGRIGLADGERLAGPLARQDRWGNALNLAAGAGQPGTVAILAATGLQARRWADVPPAHLYQILVALRRTGQEPVARMIAAEALTRA